MAGEDWDTLVVGAGVLGCATAYHVQRADPDRRVLLLDRHPRPAMGNTRRSVALFRDLFTSSTNRDLAASTIAMFDHVEDELGHPLGLQRYGYYWMMDEGRLRELRGPLADLEKRGSRLEVHDRGQVGSMLEGAVSLDPTTPPGRGRMPSVGGAVLAGNAGTLSPTRLARWFEGSFRALGGEVEYGFPVDRLVPGSVHCLPAPPLPRRASRPSPGGWSGPGRPCRPSAR